MKKARNKKQFTVQPNETIDECLARMEREDYFPVRRIEKPIFKEIKEGQTVNYEPIGRQITFEGKKIK